MIFNISKIAFQELKENKQIIKENIKTNNQY